jgi:hypothetical protein
MAWRQLMAWPGNNENNRKLSINNNESVMWRKSMSASGNVSASQQSKAKSDNGDNENNGESYLRINESY